MKRAVLVTGHYILSKRRGGFHWLADALWQAGWHVTFFTASFSNLSRLKPDHRFSYGLESQAGRPIEVSDRMVSYVWFTPWHPPNRLPLLLDWLADPVLSRYDRLPMTGAEDLVRAADLFVFESTAGLMLFDRFKALNSTARYVYRMSDDLRLLRAPLVLRRTEDAIAPQFDLVSVTSEYSFRKFGVLPNVALQYHAIQKDVYDAPSKSPYATAWSTNVVWAGVARFDLDFLRMAAPRFPKWGFHILGPIRGLPKADNIIGYGEMPFVDTVPYIKHADIGLHSIRWAVGAEHLSDSLKVIQFTYCRLPIIAPAFLGSARPNVFAYESKNLQAIEGALREARGFDRSSMRTDEIWSWSELAQRITGEVPS